MSPVSPRRLTLAAVTAVAAIAATAGPAMAGTTASCPAAAVSNPFTQWGDSANYQLAPGGDIEDRAASWTLTGGAAAVQGNETFMVSRPGDHLSLRVPATGSAATRRMCIGAEHPTFRFFVKRSGGTALSRLAVEIVVKDAVGVRALPVGLVAASATWAPSPSLRTVANLLAQAAGSTVEVSFRFRPLAGGTWSVDDLFVDPTRST